MKFHGGRLELGGGRSRPYRCDGVSRKQGRAMMAKAAAATRKKAPAWSWAPQPLVPLDRREAERDIAEIAGIAAERDLPRLAALLSKPGPVRDFLAAAFDLSDFLRDCARRRPELLDRMFDTTIAARLAAINAEVAAAAFADGVSETALMAAPAHPEVGSAIPDRAGRSRRRERARDDRAPAERPCRRQRRRGREFPAARRACAGQACTARSRHRRPRRPGGSCSAWASSAPGSSISPPTST